MKAALLKELRLVVHPSTYFIVVLGALVLIPSWMYGAIFIYGVLVAFFNGMNAREMHDLEYSFSLPLSRASMARARILTMTGDRNDHARYHDHLHRAARPTRNQRDHPAF